METTIIIIAAIAGLLGIVGSVTPVLPGPALSYSSIVLLYFIEKEAVSIISLTVLGIITAVILILSNVVPIAAAKMSGASRYGLLGSIVGTILGAIAFPPFGIFIGAIVGAMAGELYVFNDLKKAVNAGIGTIIGSILVSFVQIIFSVSIFIYFLVKIYNLMS